MLFRGSIVLLASACSFSGPAVDGDGDGDGDGDIDASVDGIDTSWLDDTFDARRGVSIDNPTDSELEGFPVYVDLAVLDDSDLDSDGAGLVFALGPTRLEHEIDAIDGKGAWVRVDLAPGGAQIFVYYASTASPRPNTSDGPATFAGFTAVYHFADSFESGDPAADATGALDINAQSNLDSAEDQVAGLVNRAVEFNDGDSEYFEMAATPRTELEVNNGENALIEVWFSASPTNIFAPGGLVDLRSNTSIGLVLAMSPIAPAGEIIGQVGTGTTVELNSGVSHQDDAFHHAALEVDLGTDTILLAIDGSIVDNDTALPGNANGGNLVIGDNFVQNAPFGGLVDEVRIGPARGVDWINATHALATDPTAVVIGVEEQRPGS